LTWVINVSSICFCFRVFQRGVSVEEFWDTKSQIMGIGFGSNTFGILGGRAKVYHIWVGANVSRRFITMGCSLEVGSTSTISPIYFARGIYYTTVYYHMTNQIVSLEADDEMNERAENETKWDEIAKHATAKRASIMKWYTSLSLCALYRVSWLIIIPCQGMTALA
jgi:hypothetical protein